eukprot:863797-Pleurochrysis_carterae.AAC.1
MRDVQRRLAARAEAPDPAAAVGGGALAEVGLPRAPIRQIEVKKVDRTLAVPQLRDDLLQRVHCPFTRRLANTALAGDQAVVVKRGLVLARLLGEGGSLLAGEGWIEDVHFAVRHASGHCILPCAIGVPRTSSAAVLHTLRVQTRISYRHQHRLARLPRLDTASPE